MTPDSRKERTQRLEAHLRQENPVLADVVQSFRRLDRVAHRLGALDDRASFADQVSWWPVISILGTFSSGKSTFINEYLQGKLQRTGNQAVDDKFTIICFGEEEGSVLPGLAVDSDPRFPFYRISTDIERVAKGEGRRVDSYLQLKVSSSESLRGKIMIDSPGFDADEQRSSTLVITDHIMDLSDLVLVFFDARHPEPGAMGDTLEHLVSNTINRPDANKFMYVLNQIDNTAREDNPEEVVAAWQRALAQQGLTAGRFYRIFSADAALPIENFDVRDRLARQREQDLAEIESRIRSIEMERAYRVVGELDRRARWLRDDIVPALEAARRTWRRRALWLSAVVFGALLAGFLTWTVSSGYWNGLQLTPVAELSTTVQFALVIATVAAIGYLYILIRRLTGRSVQRALEKSHADVDRGEALLKAFRSNRRTLWKSLASSRPRGWTRRSRRLVESVLAEADSFVQALNDRHTTPAERTR